MVIGALAASAFDRVQNVQDTGSYSSPLTSPSSSRDKFTNKLVG
jgi:hypothetical protein